MRRDAFKSYPFYFLKKKKKRDMRSGEHTLSGAVSAALKHLATTFMCPGYRTKLIKGVLGVP